MAKGYFYTIGEACMILGVSRTTLRKWEEAQVYQPNHRTGRGHRRYKKADLREFLLADHPSKFHGTPSHELRQQQFRDRRDHDIANPDAPTLHRKPPQPPSEPNDDESSHDST